MFLVLERFSDVNLSALKAVYAQTIHQTARDTFPELAENEQWNSAEMGFIDDLRNYFQIPHAKLFILQINEVTVSALRSEPYLDGALFSYLETAREMRGRGYAGELISAAVKYLQAHGIHRIYSHIHKKNFASVSVHRSNGFRICADYAKLLDGTVSQNYYTLQYNSTAE